MKANIKSWWILFDSVAEKIATEKIVLTFYIAVGGTVRILRRRWRRRKGSGEENEDDEGGGL